MRTKDSARGLAMLVERELGPWPERKREDVASAIAFLMGMGHLPPFETWAPSAQADIRAIVGEELQ